MAEARPKNNYICAFCGAEVEIVALANRIDDGAICPNGCLKEKLTK